jgi:ankyrin repeat protein
VNLIAFPLKKSIFMTDAQQPNSQDLLNRTNKDFVLEVAEKIEIIEFLKRENELVELCESHLSRGAQLSCLPLESRQAILNAAVHNGNLGLVDALIRSGVDLEHQIHLDAPIHRLAQPNKERPFSTPMLDRLLQAGASVDSLCGAGFSLLHNLCDIGDLESVKAVLDRGANMHLQDSIGRLPLHIAAARRNSAVCVELIRRGMDPDVPFESPSGTTNALFLAAGIGDTATCMELLKHGANPDTRQNNKSVWGHAGSKKHKKTAEVLKNFCTSLKATKAIDGVMAKMGMAP